jgi:hypothetical protein
MREDDSRDQCHFREQISSSREDGVLRLAITPLSEPTVHPAPRKDDKQ